MHRRDRINSFMGVTDSLMIIYRVRSRVIAIAGHLEARRIAGLIGIGDGDGLGLGVINNRHTNV